MKVKSDRETEYITKYSTFVAGIAASCMQRSKYSLLKLTAISRDSRRCIMDGRNENEYKVLSDMGDMIIEHSSGGS